MASHSDPWVTARNRYLSRLEPDEAVLFNEATIQNLYYSTSNTNREDRVSSKARKTISAVQPLVDKIEEYGKAMDTFANMAPNFLAPVWGSLRVVLVLAKSFGRFYERMTECLGRIGDILPRLFDYQRIFSHQKHPRLTESLVNTYVDIIELCMEFRGLIKAQQKNVLRRVVQPLSSTVERKFKDAEARFRAHRKTVEKEAETCHMIEAAEARAIVLRDRQLQELSNKVDARKKLFKLLSITGSQLKHEEVRSKRHQDTGSWLFDTVEYKAWYSLKGSAVLCCYGIPGCGKTILASRVIDSLMMAPKLKKLSVGYHYCHYDDKRTLDPINIFGSLVRSLFESIEMPLDIMELIQQYYRDGERIPEAKEFLDILSKTVDLFENVIIAIDGIDEVKEEDRQWIYDTLKWLTQSHRVPVKIFLSCREDAVLALCSIPGASFRVQVSENVISTDIESYIRHSVASLLRTGELAIKNPELEKAIVNTLMEGAKGMFLWVKFQLDELCLAESDSVIKRTLRDLPKDLSGTYDRLLGRVVGPDRQELVKRMFRWIICARRPLVVDELCEGIAFTIEDRRWDDDKIPTDILRLVRACGNLVVIDDESRTIKLAHYTVQQYILDEKTSKEKFFHFNIQESDELLGEVCVAYLNFSDFDTQVTVYVDNHVTAGMVAMEKAFTNVELAIPHMVSSLDAMSLFTRMIHNKTKDTNNTNIDYSRHIPKKAGQIEHLLENFRLLGYVRENWLWHTARFLPKSEKSRRDLLFHDLVLQKQLPFPFRPWHANVTTKMKYPYLEPVGWALVTNHCPLVQILLKTDPTFKPGTYFRDAGEWCFDGDRTNTHISTNMLKRIEYCAQDTWDPKSTPGQGWLYSRMLNACRRGNLDILRLCIPDLLYQFSTVDVPTEREDAKPLHEYPWFNIRGHLIIEAAASNQQTIVDYLLVGGDGAQIRTSTDGRYMYKTQERLRAFTLSHDGVTCNALERAALAGHAEMARHLSQSGWVASGLLSENAQEGLERLNRAVNEGSFGVVEAILEALSASDSLLEDFSLPYWSLRYEQLEAGKLDALLKAASVGRVAVVERCLEHGLDPLKEDAQHMCAYMRAIRNGEEGVVEFLLSAGVGCGVGANIEGLPLSMAASIGHLKFAKRLVAEGADVFSASSDASALTFIKNRTEIYIYTTQMCPTPLYSAAVNGQKAMVEYLLGIGAGPDIISPTGIISPSASRRNPWTGDVASFTRRRLFFSDEREDEIGVISRTIDVAFWQHPLAGAAINGQVEVVKILLGTGVDVNAKDSNGDSALFLAAAMGHSEIVHRLLDAGAVMEGPPTSDRAADQLLACVADRSRVAALRLLLDLGLSPNTMGVGKVPALVYAATRGAPEAVKLLLDAGAEVNSADARNITALQEACIQGRAEIAAILIDAGADMNAESKEGQSAWIHACCAGHLEVVELLISKAAPIDAVEFKGYTPLFAACRHGHLAIIELLLSTGADVNCKIQSTFVEHSPKALGADVVRGTTPLMIAATTGYTDIVAKLLNAGAELEALDEQNQTALLYAAKFAKIRTVGLLIQRGASLRAADYQGRRFLELAAEANSLTMAKYLLRLHKIAMQETPPRFLFTSKDSGEALQYAESNFDGIFTEGGELFNHFSSAKEYQMKHQRGRLLELAEMWESGTVTAPEDEEPYELPLFQDEGIQDS